MSKTALICGITGQDGSYLAQYLLKKNYNVYGTSRDANSNNLINLNKLNIKEKVNIITMDVQDLFSVIKTINKSQPDEIYFLAGQTSVSLSFELPSETIRSIEIGILNILEACRLQLNNNIKIFHAGSSESFGDTGLQSANERTAYNPRSPYGVAKSSAQWIVKNYREAYSIYVCNGILFNHESILRPDRFVTQKIIKSAISIANGSKEKLILGSLDISRDWGWAPEYVEAMWLILQQDSPEDYIIATGKTFSLKDFISVAFSYLNLDWEEHIKISESLFRPAEIPNSIADPSKIFNKLQWKAQNEMHSVINKMLNNYI